MLPDNGIDKGFAYWPFRTVIMHIIAIIVFVAS